MSDDLQILLNALTSSRGKIQTGRASPLTDPYQLRADKHMVNCSSFHQLEYDRNGTCFRWSGPANRLLFRFRLSATRRWRSSLRFIATDDQRNLKEMQLFVDGIHVDTSLNHSFGMWALDSDSFAAGTTAKTELLYIVPGSVIPSELNAESSDNRRIGIACHDLRIEPLD
jgi:hypothetical protein